MKNFRSLIGVVCLLALWGLSTDTAAQTNFWWTNGVDGAWNTTTGVWTNDAGGETPPALGGSNDFTITFQNTSFVNSTNDLGNFNFTLNQLLFNGAGVTLWGSNLVFQTSTTSVAPQLLQNSSDTIAINNNLILSNATTFTGTGSGAITVAGIISGTGGLTLNGPYTLRLSNANTYSGPTTINSGTLAISSDSNLGAAGGGLTLAGGALQVTNSFTFNNRAVTLGAAGGTFNLDPGAALLVTNNFGGNGNLTKAGSGTLTFAGAGVTFTNTAFVNAGRLVFSNTTAWATATTASNAPSIVLSNATVEFAVSSGSVSISSRLTNSISGVGTVVKTGAGTLQGLPTSTGGKTLIQLGSGSLIDIQGGTFMNGGWQPFLWAGSGWTNLASLNIASGATFDVWDGNTVFLDALTGTGTVDKKQGGASLTLNLGVNNGSGIFGGIIKNTSNSIVLVKAGAGTQILSSNNTYTGGTTIAGGTLQIGNGAGIGAVTGNITNNANLSFFRNDNPTIANIITGTGTNVFRGTGAINQNGYMLSSTNTWTGPLLITQSRVQAANPTILGNPSSITATNFGQVYLTSLTANIPVTIAGTGWTESAGNLGALRLQNSTWNGPVTLVGNARITSYGGNGTLTGAISGNSELEIGPNQNGTQFLNITPASGANTYGSTRLSLATLQVGTDGALGTGTLTFNGGTLTAITATRTLPNYIVLSNNFLIGSGQNITFTSGMDLGGGSRVFSVNNGQTVINGSIGNGGPITNSGSGIVVLNGLNTFTGGVILSNGELGISLDANIGGYTAPITFAGGVLQINGTVINNLNTHPVN